MKAISSAIVYAAISTGSADAKGTENIEVTPESIEQKGIPWKVHVQNNSGDTDPYRVWSVSISIKFRDGEKNWDAVPLYSTHLRPLGILEMRDKDGNELMSAKLCPSFGTEHTIEFEFSLHKNQLDRFWFQYIPDGGFASSSAPRYTLDLSKLINAKTLPKYHLEWPHAKGERTAKSEAPNQPPTPEERQTALERKLDEIIIPLFNPQNVTIKQAVALLGKSAKKHDTVSKLPSEAGIKILLKTISSPPTPEPRFSLLIHNESLGDIIRDLGRWSNAEVVIMRHTVVLVREGDPP